MTEFRFRLSLQAFLDRVPFRPFVIELTSGTCIYVPDPDLIDERQGIITYVTPDDPPRQYVFDHDSVAMIYDPPPGTPDDPAVQ